MLWRYEQEGREQNRAEITNAKSYIPWKKKKKNKQKKQKNQILGASNDVEQRSNSCITI